MEEDLLRAKDSAESLRLAINHMSQPRLLAGIYPEKNANWLVSKADEVASFISQLHPRYVSTNTCIIMTPPCILTHISSSLASIENHTSTLPLCMDFLISSGVEKVIRSTIEELHAFGGLEAPLIQQIVQGQKFAHWLDTLLTSTKQIIRQNPQFLDDFERNIRKRILICVIKEV